VTAPHPAWTSEVPTIWHLRHFAGRRRALARWRPSISSVAPSALAGILCVSLMCLWAAGAGSDGHAASKGVGGTQLGAARLGVVPDSGLPGYALVYARRRADPAFATGDGTAWDVVWLPGPGDGSERIIYAGSRTLSGRLPVQLGFLPSPDGRWVCVWETFYGEQGLGTEPLKTAWTAVQLRSGRKLDIGSQPGIVGYLPYWSDSQTLLLEKGATTVAFNAATGRVTPHLQTERGVPGFSGERDVDAESEPAADWRSQYLRRHFDREWEALLQAEHSFPDELGIAPYLSARAYPQPDTTVDVLLRPMGIVGLWGYRRRKLMWPTVAVSPDCRFIARAAVLRSGEVVTLARRHQLGDTSTFEARLDVYELSSGRRLWGIAIPWAATLVGDVAIARPYTRDEAWLGDLRWSGDGRYLSLTWHQARSDSVSVVDASRWTEALRLQHVTSAFVIPSVAQD